MRVVTKHKELKRGLYTIQTGKYHGHLCIDRHMPGEPIPSPNPDLTEVVYEQYTENEIHIDPFTGSFGTLSPHCTYVQVSFHDRVVNMENAAAWHLRL